MAKRKRQCGTGSIIHEKLGLAIRWPEYILLGDGGRKRKMRYEFLGEVSEREASTTLLERVARARRDGPKPLPKTPTLFTAHADLWQRTILESAGDNAADHYKYSVRDVRAVIIRSRLKPRFGNFPLLEISTSDIQEWVAELRREGLAASTIHSYYKTLSVILAAAVKWKELVESPASGVELPGLKGSKRKKWALTAKQAGALLGGIHQLRPRTMVTLALMSGLRRGELTAVRWKHLDAEAAGIHVMEASYRGEIDTPKTAAGIRYVPLDRWTWDLLEQWRKRSKHTRPDDFIFATRTGKQENPGNILRRYVFPACAAAGVGPATWNTFRRTYSTMLHNGAIPAKTIAALMGHADVDTQFIYIQTMDQMGRVAADMIGEELSRQTVQMDQINIPFVN